VRNRTNSPAPDRAQLLATRTAKSLFNLPTSMSPLSNESSSLMSARSRSLPGSKFEAMCSSTRWRSEPP